MLLTPEFDTTARRGMRRRWIVDIPLWQVLVSTHSTTHHAVRVAESNILDTDRATFTGECVANGREITRNQRF